MPQGKPKETNNLRKEIRPTPKKTKFGRKATKEDESTKGMDLKTILIGTFPISLKCSTIPLNLPFFKSKEMEESLVEVEKEHSQIEKNIVRG